MQYIGIQTQQKRNNIRSLLLLFLFPVLVLLLTFLFCCIFSFIDSNQSSWQIIFNDFLLIAPWVSVIILVWFVIAFFFNVNIIKKATNSHTLERKDNKRVYNLLENLCMAQGMPMPKLNVIDDESLNAFASGISDKTYTITLTTGIIDTLDDQELEGVIAHELSHIRNRDVRLLIVSIVFVGIFTMIMTGIFHIIPRMRGGGKNKGGLILFLLIIGLLAAIGSFASSITRFAISRKREYMADAGAAEMTRNPWALASALRKISGNSHVESVEREDVAQLFIEHPVKKKKSFFATHPPIEDRISVLENF